MNKIVDYINETSFFNELIAKTNKGSDLRITNVNDNISLVLLATFFKQSGDNLLIVVPNIFRAQKIYDKLIDILDEDQISFFPQDEFITTEMLAMSEDFKLERINTIQKIINKRKSIIITNTTGFIKPLIPRSSWETALISLETGKIIDINTFTKKLVSIGYKKVSSVENHGEFNVRGSIIDVYPLNESRAVRIDLFDDEIDSIRYFDVSTQRSNIKIKDVTIYPMYEFFYSTDQFQELKNTIEVTKSQKSFIQEDLDRIESDMFDLENYNNLDKYSRYISLMYKKSATILDYLDNNQVIFFDEKRINESYEDILRDITDWYETTNTYPKIGFELVKDINHVYSKKTIYMDVFDNYKRVSNISNVIRLKGKEATLYDNNYHMIINDLKKYNNYITTVITLENNNKLDKFIEILDNKVEYKLLSSKDKIVKKKINLMIGKSLPLEFYDTNLIVINEDNLFKVSGKKQAKYKSNFKDTKKLSSIDDLKKGDYIVHYDYGIGRFLGIETMSLGKNINDYIKIAYKGEDSLYIPVENINLIQKYSASDGAKPRLHKLGSGDWAKTKSRVRKKVKDIADKLIKLYAEREKAVGFSFSEDTSLMYDFEAEFPYEETIDQLKAIEDVKKDMESKIPMDRLLCGDVGYGKTEVALRGAFKAVLDNKQVAYLAPTTVLSRQHYNTFKKRLDKHGIRVELLNRFVTPAKQKKLLHDIRNGFVDIVIGTHRLLSKDMKYLDLGLLIIDEEQRFGVEHKEKIKEYKVNVDVLSLSATPIPRTLQMAIMGVKSMSLLETPPKNRYPIQTYVMERHDSIIRDSIQREMARDGQVFYLYNRVDDIEQVANNIEKLVPEARVIYAHGKMSRVQLEDTIEAFLDKKYDVLVSTTIIETGIDIPNANTLLIHDSDNLGLSQLYQIRGRVGRSDKIAYAYLMYKKNKRLNEEAQKRLQVIKEFTELGSGFKIAMRDLSIRGAGDVLGSEQSGFIDSVGIDLYLEILKDEIAKQKGEKPLIEEPETTLKIKVNKYIDSNYINNDFVKIEMHRKIANIKTKNDIESLTEEFTDRFGIPSEEVDLYMHEKLFEHLAKIKGVEKIREFKNTVTLVINETQSSGINGEYLFLKANEISKFINFSYKNNKLHILVDTLKLDKHHIYLMIDILELL